MKTCRTCTAKILPAWTYCNKCSSPKYYCKYCGVLLNRKKKYCSEECKKLDNKKIKEKKIKETPLRQCLFCEEDFVPKQKRSRFCSTACHMLHHHATRRLKKQTFKVNAIKL